MADGDYDALVQCIEQLSAVKERTAATDEMFEPLKETIELLRQYGQELPEEVHDQLQVSLELQRHLEAGAEVHSELYTGGKLPAEL